MQEKVIASPLYTISAHKRVHYKNLLLSDREIKLTSHIRYFVVIGHFFFFKTVSLNTNIT